MSDAAPRPKLAVWKFASCDGCQLSLLDCEDELLALADAVEIAHFLEATRASVAGPYDVSLVEGSITTPRDAERIREVRAQSKVLVTIGACAGAGGVQALKNFARADDWIRLVYATPEYVDTLATSEPIAAHVKVDFELHGCPVDKAQLVEVILALVRGRTPRTPAHTVCVDCKRAGHTCVTVAHGTPCLGPVTQAGCGALCPGWNRGCYGCFGPAATNNAAGLDARLLELGTAADARRRLFSTYYAAAPDFRDRHDAEGPAADAAADAAGEEGSP